RAERAREVRGTGVGYPGRLLIFVRWGLKARSSSEDALRVNGQGPRLKALHARRARRQGPRLKARSARIGSGCAQRGAELPAPLGKGLPAPAPRAWGVAVVSC